VKLAENLIKVVAAFFVLTKVFHYLFELERRVCENWWDFAYNKKHVNNARKNINLCLNKISKLYQAVKLLIYSVSNQKTSYKKISG
jgi:hypothetical protein